MELTFAELEQAGKVVKWMSLRPIGIEPEPVDVWYGDRTIGIVRAKADEFGVYVFVPETED